MNVYIHSLVASKPTCESKSITELPSFYGAPFITFYFDLSLDKDDNKYVAPLGTLLKDNYLFTYSLWTKDKKDYCRFFFNIPTKIITDSLLAKETMDKLCKDFVNEQLIDKCPNINICRKLLNQYHYDYLYEIMYKLIDMFEESEV